MAVQVIFDFETFSTLSLKDAGSYRYCRFPTTTWLCLGYQIDDDPIRVIWNQGIMPEDLREAFDSGANFHAWNVTFDWLTWNHCTGWPTLDRERCHDIMARAAYYNLPLKLEKAVPILCPNETKDMAGHRLMLSMSRPGRKGDDSHHTDERKARLMQYCREDIRVERLMHDRLGPLPTAERQVQLMDWRMNDRGVRIDFTPLENMRRAVEDYAKPLEHRFRTLTGLTGPRASVAFREWLNAHGVEASDVAKNTVEGLLQKTDLPPRVQEALEIRQELALSSPAKIVSAIDHMEIDGRVRGSFQYYGATQTGRWAGRDVQPQNLPRGRKDMRAEEVHHIYDLFRSSDQKGVADQIDLLWGPLPSAISSCLRGMFLPDQLCSLLVADYGQIEARIVNWLCGQDDVLEIFRAHDNGEGPDVYVINAARLHGLPLDQITKDLRQQGKVQELGGGFGMGPGKMQATAREQYGLELSNSMAEKIIQEYRTTHPRVVQGWRTTEKAALLSIQHPGSWVRVEGTRGLRFACGKSKGTDFLAMELPSGRRLHYCRPRLKPDTTPWGTPTTKITFESVDSYTKQWVRSETWGGTLIENAVQAIARDLMVYGMLEAEQQGFPPLMTVHDEVVTCAPEDRAKTLLPTFIRCLTLLPDWAKGIPLVAEGFIAPRYRK